MSGDATVTHADLSKLVKKQQEAIDAVRELIEAVRINGEASSIMRSEVLTRLERNNKTVDEFWAYLKS